MADLEVALAVSAIVDDVLDMLCLHAQQQYIEVNQLHSPDPPTHASIFANNSLQSTTRKLHQAH